MWEAIVEYIKLAEVNATTVMVAIIAVIPYLFTFLNGRQTTSSQVKKDEAEAHKLNADAHKIDADAAAVITNTSRQWIEDLNNAKDELTQEAEDRDRIYKQESEERDALLEKERRARQQLAEIVKENKIQQEADRAAWLQDQAIFLESQQSWRVEKAELIKTWEADRVGLVKVFELEKAELIKSWEADRQLLLGEVAKCYDELRLLIETKTNTLHVDNSV